jgi:uncharacterized surface protein with fasciclin (FAS1) repeats
MSSITQIVNSDKNMTTLKTGLHYSDVDQLLSGNGPFTFFAPSNIAFEKQGNSFMADLMTKANKPALTDLLHSHIVDGMIRFQNLKDGDKLTTLNGKELSVEVKGGRVRIDGLPIEIRQQHITNGVIHSTDTVFIKK